MTAHEIRPDSDWRRVVAPATEEEISGLSQIISHISARSKDKLIARIRQLEAEVENWRNREAGLKRSTRRRRDEIIEVQDERNALRAAAQERDRQIVAQAEEIGRLKKAIRYAFQTGDCDEIWDLGGAIVDAETEAALKPESTGR